MKDLGKPDFETESFRVWHTPKGTKAEKELQEALKEENPLKVKYKDMEVTLHGFVKVIHKKTKKIVFAYKFKHADKGVLYYIADKKSKDAIKALETLNRILTIVPAGYQLMDVMDKLKVAYLERHVLEKMGEDK